MKNSKTLSLWVNGQAFNLVDEASVKARELGLGNSRIWSLIAYPEHYGEEAIKAWLSYQLLQRGFTGAISPLHDMDLLPFGVPERPHFHIMIKSNTSHSAAFPLWLSRCINTNFVPVERVLDELAMYRYHCHTMQSDKTLYDDNARFFIGDYVIPSAKGKANELFAQLMLYANDCHTLHELVRVLWVEKPDLLPLVERNYRTLKAFYGIHY